MRHGGGPQERPACRHATLDVKPPELAERSCYRLSSQTGAAPDTPAT